MNNRTLVNIGLFVFLIISIFIFSNRNDNININLLTSMNTDKINTIQIHKNSTHDIKFNKDNNNIWRMTSPYNLKAHQFRINTLLGLIQTPVDTRYDIEALDLSDYALEPPRARITFDQTDVLFGKTNPVNNKRYLLADNKMVLLNDQVYPLVSAQAASFIDLSLIPDDFTIKRIETPSTLIQLVNDTWESSKANKLNADQIQSLLQHWKSAQAFAVHKYMPRKQLGKIEIRDRSETITFEITDDDPWLILAIPEINIEYHLDNSLKNILYGNLKPDSPDA
ncbi:MAG: hypothetical protein DIZ80_11885 [endosymbiont of Galathealinum brachiosum]|uniref:DUF4340 domain-containing protein n=1 Tax=endosymbiont of Galathealinum brachiosum TaxID=2200906 RepID=A0A370DF80_9GAMM|nr:MAG: hypothetical protein DIZ80_11885 [endosymbiont of Galathealinum brachiosum]